MCATCTGVYRISFCPISVSSLNQELLSVPFRILHVDSIRLIAAWWHYDSPIFDQSTDGESAGHGPKGTLGDECK